MEQGEPLTMTRAEWRKADPDTKAIEDGQHWLLVRRDGAVRICPVLIVRQADQTARSKAGTKKP